MSSDEGFDRTADLCIEACRAVLEHGTPAMRATARLLLTVLARELVERASVHAQAVGSVPKIAHPDRRN